MNTRMIRFPLGCALAAALLLPAAAWAGVAEEPPPATGGPNVAAAALPPPGSLGALFTTGTPDVEDADAVPLVEQYKEGGGTGRQSSTAHIVFFWLGAAAALLGAIAVIVARRPMRSALGLLVVVLATAGLYLLLRAELLAALQVLIYAGAVVVLLVFVITFLEQGAIAMPGGRRLPVRVLAVAAIVYVLYLVSHELFAMGLGTRLPPAPGFGTTASLGHALFTTFLVPFEAVSALLLTAIVGAVAVAKGKTADGGPAAPAEPAASGTADGGGA
jgi:NADH-quinone oxidoreductase subunit J